MSHSLLSTNGSLIFAVQSRAKCRFREAAILLFYSIKKILTKLHIFRISITYVTKCQEIASNDCTNAPPLNSHGHHFAITNSRNLKLIKVVWSLIAILPYQIPRKSVHLPEGIQRERHDETMYLSLSSPRSGILLWKPVDAKPL
jgi:hypothetical protein